MDIPAASLRAETRPSAFHPRSELKVRVRLRTVYGTARIQPPDADCRHKHVWDGAIIQPGYSVLPHTGLTYRIALGVSNLYGDTRSVDGYGLDVDVVLPEIDTLKPSEFLRLAQIAQSF